MTPSSPSGPTGFPQAAPSRRVASLNRVGASGPARDPRVLVLAEGLRFGRAAARLGLTTSRTGQVVRALEARIGGRLFERTSRLVALTRLGEHLKATMAPATSIHRRTSLRRARDRAPGSLRIGLYTAINGGPYPVAIITTFERRHPTRRVQRIDTSIAHNGTDQPDPLRRGDVDLLAMRRPLSDPDLVVGPVLSLRGARARGARRSSARGAGIGRV